jgi:NTE family protein
MRHSSLLLSRMLVASLALFGAFDSSQAQPKGLKHRPKVGLVLAGGGALGMAHVGVLKVLEANRIPVDIITGTSMGSIVGAGYASGASVQEMEEILSKTDWDALFNETISRQDVQYRSKYGRAGQFLGDAKIGVTGEGLTSFMGVVSGQHVLPLLQRLYYRTPGDIDFDKLPVPYRAIAADIETGKAVVLDSGDLARSARASMAVPGFFTPVEMNGKFLVDGGIANNLPVDVALSMGAQKLIVVDLVADLKKKNELSSILNISGQIISILLAQNSDLQRKNMRKGDLLLEPDLKGYSATDFNKASEIFAKGEAVALAHVDQLRKFSVSEEEYREYQRARSGVIPEAPLVAAVSVTTDLPAEKQLIESTFSDLVGKPFDAAIVQSKINELSSEGQLASLTYRVERNKKGETTIALDGNKPKWYDQYFQVGFSLQDDFKGDSAYQLALGARFNSLNQAGAFLDLRLDIGWRPMLELDYYQPLYENSSYFINPIVTLDRYQVPVQVDRDVIAEYARNRFIGGIGMGRKLGKSGELQVGLERGTGEFSRHIGDPSLPEGSYEIGDYFGKINVDSRDTPDFPTKGLLFDFKSARNTENLGSSDEFTQLSGSAQLPLTYGVNTLTLSSDYGTNLETVPANRVFVLGGMFDIAGYQPGGLSASDFFVGRVTYYRELASLGGAFAKLNLFGGGEIELASLRSDIAQIEDDTNIVGGLLFLGADTPILPIYLAAGTNNDHESAVYFNVGRIFKPRK